MKITQASLVLSALFFSVFFFNVVLGAFLASAFLSDVGDTILVYMDKRFWEHGAFLKKEKIQDLDAVKSYYGYSNEKAQQSLKILTKEQIAFIKQKLDVGGKR